MNLSRIATALVLALVAFVFYFGTGFLVAPESTAAGFGLPAWPHGEAAAFLNIKGVRDVTSGMVILVLLLARQRFALGIAVLTFALAPVGDMITVLSHHGSAAMAFGVHGLTAVGMALTGALLIRERRAVGKPVPQPIPAAA
ncbi:DUF4267 domain-containing protein [Nocardia mexicana]|uniref:Uncharacterized protein DUF4267 n=1 Tax=Nocardia mexicana TaxID=279262 RepID=A0A370HE53_9NOCA|nr:DUF4267 domain-containing protein [Nocardia mexicana]RDI53153.1 uncharacterized protein DUF4267 [Nocardia mexicana]